MQLISFAGLTIKLLQPASKASPVRNNHKIHNQKYLLPMIPDQIFYYHCFTEKGARGNGAEGRNRTTDTGIFSVLAEELKTRELILAL
jgi:hypothetical protein